MESLDKTNEKVYDDAWIEASAYRQREAKKFFEDLKSNIGNNVTIDYISGDKWITANGKIKEVYDFDKIVIVDNNNQIVEIPFVGRMAAINSIMLSSGGKILYKQAGISLTDRYSLLGQEEYENMRTHIFGFYEDCPDPIKEDEHTEQASNLDDANQNHFENKYQEFKDYFNILKEYIGKTVVIEYVEYGNVVKDTRVLEGVNDYNDIVLAGGQTIEFMGVNTGIISIQDDDSIAAKTLYKNTIIGPSYFQTVSAYDESWIEWRKRCFGPDEINGRLMRLPSELYGQDEGMSR